MFSFVDNNNENSDDDNDDDRDSSSNNNNNNNNKNNSSSYVWKVANPSELGALPRRIPTDSSASTNPSSLRGKIRGGEKVSAISLEVKISFGIFLSFDGCASFAGGGVWVISGVGSPGLQGEPG